MEDNQQAQGEHEQEGQYHQEGEEVPFIYDGPIDPATENQILELNDDGAKAFALEDYEVAVEKFGLASEMLGQVYGETNPKCADTLFMYGKALLELAIKQSSVLGGATENSTHEAVVTSESSAAGASSSSSSAGPSNPRHVFEGDGEGWGEEDEEAEDEGQEAAEEEESDDFAVAWDVLDLVRVLYHRQGTEEALLKLGDVHMALGDVSLESENFTQAVADFREAIAVKEARLEPDDRQLAEAYYKLALALEYAPNETETPQEYIHKAISVLRARIQKNQLSNASGKGKARAGDMSDSETKMAKEVIELHELVGEMEQKVQDLIANEAKKPVEGKTQLEMLTEMVAQQRALVANDISSLIKPKPNKSTLETTALAAASSSSSSSSSAPATEASSTSTPAEEIAVDSGSKRKAEDSVDESAEKEDKKVKV